MFGEEKDSRFNFESVCRASQKGNVDYFRDVFVSRQFHNEWLVKKCHQSSGDTILHVAARFGRLSILEFIAKQLLADLNMEWSTKKVDIFDSINTDRKTPLHEAAQSDHADCVRFLLEQNVNVDSMKRADWTPLMLAVAKGNKDVVIQLLNASANPALVNKDGWNSFHLACREGNLEIVKLLSDTKPDLWKVASKNGRTPLHTAALVSRLVNAPVIVTPAYLYEANRIRAALTHNLGFLINMWPPSLISPSPPVLLKALHGCKDVICWLLETCRHPVDAEDSCGNTPLMDAIRSGHTQVAGIMIQNFKADLMKTDRLGNHLLHVASQSGHLTSVRYLLENFKVDVNVVSDKNVTPLHLAAKEGHADIIGTLLSSGANVHLQDQMGRTALNIAENSRHLDCVRLLKEKC